MTNGWRDLYQKNKSTVNFVLLFSLFIIIAHLIVFLIQITDFIVVLNNMTARLVFLSLRTFTSEVIMNNEVLIWGNFSLKIITECTGLFLFIVYAGAVVSFPTTWRKKALGLLGLPALFLLNLVRLLVLMLIGRYYRSAFDFVHHYLWQTTFIIAVIAVWMVWVELVVHDGQQAGDGLEG